MKTLFLLPVVFAVGCLSVPAGRDAQGNLLPKGQHLVKVRSEPPGARVFVSYAANEDSAKTSRSYLGTTPFDWPVTGNPDGSFKLPGALVYSIFVPPVAVFTAEPGTNAAGQYPQRMVIHGGTIATPAERIPEGIFFDMTKP